MAVLRSLLFAPGNHPRKVEKALGLDADGVILDLEDAVALSEKVQTRAAVRAALAQPRQGLAYVRVNGFDTPFCYQDLVAVVRPGLDGVILPKVESPSQLVAVDWLLTQLEREAQMPEGAVDLIPIIETARGVDGVEQIAAAHTRTRRLAFGAGDYSLDVNVSWSRAETELEYVRSRLVVASRAAGLEPPLDTVFVHLGEPENFVASVKRAKALGFQGKTCIHPEQIAAVNAEFAPSEDEVAKARAYVAAFELAEAEGSASIQVDGYFIDYPIVEKAKRVLALAERVARKGR